MRGVILLVIVALGGCVQAQVEPSPAVTAVALPVAPAAMGAARLTVDVARRTDGLALAADCVASSENFSVDFRSPAVVAIPTFGASSGPVRVSCRSGELRGATVSVPSISQPRVRGWPAVGIGVSSGGGTSVSVGGIYPGGYSPAPYAAEVRYSDVMVRLD
jgi:hypothetical protein